jgi:hypothetical protein
MNNSYLILWMRYNPYRVITVAYIPFLQYFLPYGQIKRHNRVL